MINQFHNERFLSALFILFVSFLLLFIGPAVRADETASSSSFGTGALIVENHGSIVTAAGYSGKITNAPALVFGNNSTLQLNGFIGAGAMTNSGSFAGFVGIYPSLTFGSLNIGAGVAADLSNMSAHGIVTLSFTISQLPVYQSLPNLRYKIRTQRSFQYAT